MTEEQIRQIVREEFEKDIDERMKRFIEEDKKHLKTIIITTFILVTSHLFFSISRSVL